MKRFISILTVILMLVSCCVFSTGTISAAEGDFTYKEVTGGVEITGFTADITERDENGDIIEKSLNIPETLGGLPVVGIGEKAFYQNKSQVNIIIPEGIEYIGERAFAGSMITGVTMPQSVTTLGNSAFSSCVYLADLTLSENIHTIPNSCFYLCTRLESVEIPEGIKVIDDMAFQSSNHLTAVDFPSTLELIGEYAFAYTGLTKVIIPEGTEVIEAYAFFICDKLTDVIISGTVKTIGEFAFANCYTLTSLILSDGIEAIGTSAFDSCAITEIIIPDSVTEIGEYAIGYVYDEFEFEYTLIKDFKITCKEGTAGYAYAMSNGFQNVEAIPADTTAPTETTEATETTASDPATSEVTEPSSTVTEPSSTDNTEPSSAETQPVSSDNTEPSSSASEPVSSDNTDPLDPNILEVSKAEGADKSEGSGYVFGYLGDIDLTDTVNIRDATAIQKQVASLLSFKESNTILADVDFSGSVNIKDATTIQKWVAGLTVSAPVYHLLYAPYNTSNHIHAYKFISISPTCKDKGYTEYTCACGDTYIDNWTNIISTHSYKNGVCTICGADEPHTHSYSTKVIAPTCKDKGYTLHKCSCGDEYKDSWVNITSTHSYKDGVCTICGSDEPHTHSYSTKVIVPTCKDKGYTLHKCSCGDEYKDNWVNVTSTHSYKDGVCTICGADEPHTHSYSTKVVAPTCKDKGYTLHKCSCGDEYRDTWTDPQHKFSNSYCTKCNISSYDYLVSWIKTHGKLNSTDGYYSYEFNTSNAPNGISDFSFSIEYYYDLDEITLFLHDSSTMTGTMVTIFSDTLEDYFAQCICSSQTFDIRSVIGFSVDSHIMTSPIYVSYYESDTIPLDDIIDITKIYAHYTIAVSDYCLKSTNVGVAMSDFGFTKEYSSLEGKMPFDKDHVHTYKKTDDSHTTTEPGVATFTCSCGSEYWIESSHTFESYECIECGITPFDYYANWIKDNGTVNGDRYEYTFTSIYNIENTEDLSVNVYYYPVLDSEPCITLHLYDSYFNETTMIFLYEDDAIAFCGSTNGDYTIYTEIDITEYTDNTPIQPDSDSRYSSTSEIENTRQNINLTLSAHGYSMLSEVEGLSLYDLGFYSY